MFNFSFYVYLLFSFFLWHSNTMLDSIIAPVTLIKTLFPNYLLPLIKFEVLLIKVSVGISSKCDVISTRKKPQYLQ